MQIKARDVLNYSSDYILTKLPVQIVLEFDDGAILHTTRRRTELSRQFWELHIHYPDLPLLSHHHVDYVLGGKPLTSKTHEKLLELLLKEVVRKYNLRTYASKEPVLKLMYKITNNISIENGHHSEPYLSSIDILDFIGVVSHRDIEEINNNLEPVDVSIAGAYKKAEKVLKTSHDLTNNALVKAVRSETVNMLQVLQSTIAIGFRTEVDGFILPVPIMSNFIRGLTNFYDYAAESRSAAKSLYFAEAPLQDSEYFSRRLQFLTMTVENVANVDCGSTKYLEWFVRSPMYNEEGKMVYAGDLTFMQGKYYIDDETGYLKEIVGIDKNLYDRTIKLRAVEYCQHPDPKIVCEVCFGTLASNVSRHANLGNLSTNSMTQQSSQNILKTKHIDSVSAGNSIILNSHTSKYFSVDTKSNSFILNGWLANRNSKIVFSRDEAIGLTDLPNITNIENVSPLRMSSIKELNIIYDSKEQDSPGQIIDNIKVAQRTRNALISREFLMHIKETGWITDDKNNFVIDISTWTFDTPILNIPNVEYSYSNHAGQLASLIESSIKNIDERSKPGSPGATLQELFVLVNSKLFVNLSILEIFIYSLMVPEFNKYGLARNCENPILGISQMIIKNRSLGAFYPFQEQYQTIINPRSFFQLDRPDSIFDVFICPKEVVDQIDLESAKMT